LIDWLDLLRDTLDASLADPGPNLERHTADAEAPGYYEDLWCWSQSAPAPPSVRQFDRAMPC